MVVRTITSVVVVIVLVTAFPCGGKTVVLTVFLVKLCVTVLTPLVVESLSVLMRVSVVTGVLVPGVKSSELIEAWGIGS